jgi:hypothetical protein
MPLGLDRHGSGPASSPRVFVHEVQSTLLPREAGHTLRNHLASSDHAYLVCSQLYTGRIHLWHTACMSAPELNRWCRRPPGCCHTTT